MATGTHSDGERVIDGWNRLFNALSAEPRRQIIVALLEAPPDRQLSLPEAANPPYALREPEELYVELYHSHLPVLAEGEYVEWATDPLRVGRGPAFEEAAVVFRSLHDGAEEIPDSASKRNGVGSMTDHDIVVDLATALARAEGVEPHELDVQLQEHVDTDAVSRLVAMDNTDWRLTVTVADHEVTIDGTGGIRVDGEVQHVVRTDH
jgi:hypothetical protein